MHFKDFLMEISESAELFIIGKEIQEENKDEDEGEK
jgi:hypothetical protein